MGTKKKADYMVDNGTDWDQMLFSTTAEQVGFTKSDGSETNLQDEVTALNSQITTMLSTIIRDATYSTNDCNDVGTALIASFANFDGTGNSPWDATKNVYEVRGIILSLTDNLYPAEGYQTTQVFFSYFGSVYSRVMLFRQGVSEWVKLNN